jgi:hypothetical protein
VAVAVATIQAAVQGQMEQVAQGAVAMGDRLLAAQQIQAVAVAAAPTVHRVRVALELLS